MKGAIEPQAIEGTILNWAVGTREGDAPKRGKTSDSEISHRQSMHQGSFWRRSRGRRWWVRHPGTGYDVSRVPRESLFIFDLLLASVLESENPSLARIGQPFEMEQSKVVVFAIRVKSILGFIGCFYPTL